MLSTTLREFMDSLAFWTLLALAAALFFVAAFLGWVVMGVVLGPPFPSAEYYLPLLYVLVVAVVALRTGDVKNSMPVFRGRLLSSDRRELFFALVLGAGLGFFVWVILFYGLPENDFRFYSIPAGVLVGETLFLITLPFNGLRAFPRVVLR